MLRTQRRCRYQVREHTQAKETYERGPPTATVAVIEFGEAIEGLKSIRQGSSQTRTGKALLRPDSLDQVEAVRLFETLMHCRKDSAYHHTKGKTRRPELLATLVCILNTIEKGPQAANKRVRVQAMTAVLACQFEPFQALVRTQQHVAAARLSSIALSRGHLLVAHTVLLLLDAEWLHCDEAERCKLIVSVHEKNTHRVRRIAVTATKHTAASTNDQANYNYTTHEQNIEERAY